MDSWICQFIGWLYGFTDSVHAPHLALRRENISDWLADELTILGAWDYAVTDPDGFLGGAKSCFFAWSRGISLTQS